jgi:transcriptional regulator GlxA family with amidase domain
MCVTISDMARRIAIVVYDGVQLLDAVGPLDVFAAANFVGAAGDAAGLEYEPAFVAIGPRARSTSGPSLDARPIAALRGPIDTLMVAGGLGTNRAADDPALVAHVRRLAGRARRVTSVCSGTLLLARAGLLEGRRVTTHWSVAASLARRHPEIEVDADPIYIQDGDVWTSAGVTAGIDLALALVADDLGTAVANDVARWFVLPARRSGFQSQYSPQLAVGRADADFADLLAWLPGNLDADLTVAALAARVHLGERQFARRFKDGVGVTPAEHVESLRLDGARALLESGSLDVAAIARRCGFRNRETLHRTFVRRFGVTPAAHRAAFGAH